jgi:hypothetical protein
MGQLPCSNSAAVRQIGVLLLTPQWSQHDGRLAAQSQRMLMALSQRASLQVSAISMDLLAILALLGRIPCPIFIPYAAYSTLDAARFTRVSGCCLR